MKERAEILRLLQESCGDHRARGQFQGNERTNEAAGLTEAEVVLRLYSPNTMLFNDLQSLRKLLSNPQKGPAREVQIRASTETSQRDVATTWQTENAAHNKSHALDFDRACSQVLESERSSTEHLEHVRHSSRDSSWCICGSC